LASRYIVWSVQVPIACTLNTDAATDRIEEWRSALRTSVTAATRTAPGRVELRLAQGPSAAGLLVELARREKACCGFFTFAVQIDAEGATMVVEVPDEAFAALDAFAAMPSS
jgi:hypothetical protein